MNRLNWLLVAVLALAGVTGVRGESQPATLPATATPAPKDLPRHKDNLTRIAQGPIGAVFFGDSITDGWRQVPELWKESFGQYAPANFGISGDRTQHVLWRMLNGELEGYQAKVVVLMIGTNNVSAGDSPEQVLEGIRRILQTLSQKQPQAKVLLLGIFPREQSPGKLRQEIQQINEQLHTLADGQKVRYLDIGDRFVNEDGTISKEIMPDYLHLSKEGYERWAKAIGPVLAEMVKSE